MRGNLGMKIKAVKSKKSKREYFKTFSQACFEVDKSLFI